MSIRNLAAAIALLGFGSLPAYANAGAENGQPFQHLQEQVDLLAGDLAEVESFLQTQIDDLVASQASQDVLIAALQSAVSSLGERVAANEGDIASLQAFSDMQDQLIAALTSQLAGFEARVAANEADIAAIILVDQTTQQLIDATILHVQTLQSLMAATTGDVSTLEQQIAQVEAQLVLLESDLLAKQARVLGVCPTGSSIRLIDDDGDVVCEPDTVGSGVGTLSTTTVTASDGIPNATFVRQSGTATATCPSTYRITGGGHDVTGGNLGWGHVDRSRRSGNGWHASVVTDSVGSRTLVVYALCARVQ